MKSIKRCGILAGGNWIIDQVKVVDVYPPPEQLANIREQAQGTGGAPFNVLVNLARLGVRLPLAGAGLVGKDALGEAIFAECKCRRIDTRFLTSTDAGPTSYTDVMTEQGSGRRTFFHHRGVNALWRGEEVDFQRSTAAIFHLGYLLLLDALDKPDRKFGTRAARMLAEAQAAGLKTSVDVVSEESDRFARTVLPALKYVDYCILNEIEAGKTTGFMIRRKKGGLDTGALRRSARALLKSGVREVVVVHFPEGGYALSGSGEEVWQSSVKLPASFIAGSAGAGDAFCTGTLLGLHEGWGLERSLKTAVCVAAASLSHATCTGGMKSLSGCLALGRKYGFRPKPQMGV